MCGMTDHEESSWTQISDSDLERIVQEIQELLISDRPDCLVL